MKIPRRLKDMGIDEKEYFTQIDSMINQIEKDICSEHTPRKFSRSEMEKFLRELY